MSEDILLTVSERIATLTFNRPASLNSLSLGSIQTLLQHLRDLSVRSDVRALVLTGQGRGFARAGNWTWTKCPASRANPWGCGNRT